MSEQPMTPEPQIECGHECLKDNSHVERGEPHFYGYSFPSKSDLRAQLTQREAELAALPEKVRGRYCSACGSLDDWCEANIESTHGACCKRCTHGRERPDFPFGPLAALSDRQEGHDA